MRFIPENVCNENLVKHICDFLLMFRVKTHFENGKYKKIHCFFQDVKKTSLWRAYRRLNPYALGTAPKRRLSLKGISGSF